MKPSPPPTPHRTALTYADLRILDKAQRLVPLTLNRAQRHLLGHLSGRDLVLKARQLGISTAVQAHFFLTALRQTARIGTIAHDADTTAKLREMASSFYDLLPDEDRPPRSLHNATRTLYPHTRSIVYIATAGNRSAGRGGTYSHVHGSEVAYWRHGAALLAGLLQGVPAGGQIVLESTANGQQGWFYEQCMKALDGDSTWTLHFYPWWWDDGYRVEVLSTEEVLSAEQRVLRSDFSAPDTQYSALSTQHSVLGTQHLQPDEARLVERHGLDAGQIAWRRLKLRELGDLFYQEYPEDPHTAFLASGRGYFSLRDALFSADADAAPQEGHRYVAGLDFGQARDYTVCCVLDVTTRRQVALLRVHRESWAAMRARVVALCARWRVSTLVAESNSMGGANIEALWGELNDAGCETEVRPFQMTHASKTAAMAELRLALEEGGLRLLDDAAQRHELRVFTSHQLATGAWQLAAPQGDHDDTVIALALAWQAVGGGMFLFGA